jgi:hypothetical protein
VHLSHGEEQYLLEEGDPLEVTLRGASRLLTPGQKLVLTPPEASPAD